jgi:glycolate oxidase FAD binding subunit
MSSVPDTAKSMEIQAGTVEAIQDAVRTSSRPLFIRGGGTKRALSSVADATCLDVRGLAGIVEYDPGEYTFTARAGTPLREIALALAEHGQYLPFDPPLVEQGATLGGTVAAGLSGAGRMRFGGVRDFLIGVRFVDGQGRLVRGGGKVVKNAAGFDLPKLLVGSLGRLGVLTEVSFKVFPAPPQTATLAVKLPGLADAVAASQRLMVAPLDLDALDFTPTDAGAMLWVRLGGLAGALPPRLARIQALLNGGRVLDDDAAAAHWADQRAFAWLPEGAALVKAATTPGQLKALDARLAEAGATRLYSVGGNLAWIGWPGPLDVLDQALAAAGLGGLVLIGEHARPLIGRQPGGPFLQKIQQTLDPAGRFPRLVTTDAG